MNADEILEFANVLCKEKYERSNGVESRQIKAVVELIVEYHNKEIEDLHS